MFKRLAGAIAAITLFCASPAHAIDYRLDFQVNGFLNSPLDDSPPPFSTVTGFAIFSADSTTSEWKSMSDFNVTIGDYHLGLADVSHYFYSDATSIGGNPGGVNGITFGVTDFFWGIVNGYGMSFTYTYEGVIGYWEAPSSANSYTYTEIAVTPVPELETYGMMLAGLGLLGVAARRRKV